MTLGGRLISLFPLFHALLLVEALLMIAQNPAWTSVLFFLGILYIFPLVSSRIHNFFLPVQEGNYELAQKKYNPWWGSHMIQLIFVAIPWLEAPLHFVPGLFSLWLRLWGSEIGNDIYWTPRVEVIDRGLISVGSGTVIGHLTIFCSHMVADIDGRPMLVLKKIFIGENSFIGADTQLGPGAQVQPKTKLKPKTRLYWRGVWP